MRGGDADDSLAISRDVSTAVVEVVHAALAAHPASVVAKGGITSHDVAVRGLGIRRAEVIGASVPRYGVRSSAHRSRPRSGSAPYVVFAGNGVGDDNTLADVVDLLAGRSITPSRNPAQSTPRRGRQRMTNVGWIGLGAMSSPMASSSPRPDTRLQPSTSTRRRPRPSQATASKPRPPSVTRPTRCAGANGRHRRQVESVPTGMARPPRHSNPAALCC